MSQKYDIPKITLAIIVFFYFIYYARTASDWHFIDNINLIFHEAGHTLTMFFGQFVSIAGGSFLQIAIPAVCAFYFYAKGQDYSSSLLLFWIGQNFINVSVYAGDAVNMHLPLLGGDGVIHDWNYLLAVTGMLRHTELIANLIYSVGISLFVIALLYAFKSSVVRREGFEPS